MNEFSTSGPFKARFRRVAAAAACAALVLAMNAFQADAQGGVSKPVILVGDFKNESGDSSLDSIGVGIAIQITAVLSRLSSVSVIPGDARRLALAEARLSASGFAAANPALGGSLASATHVVYGTYTVIGEELMAAAYAVDANSGEAVGSATVSAYKPQAGSICVQLAQSLVEDIRDEFPAKSFNFEIIEENTDPAIERARNYSLDILSAKGELENLLYRSGLLRRGLSREEIARGLELCEFVLAEFPDDADTLLNYGNALSISGGETGVAKSVEVFKTLLEMDPDSAAGHLNLGAVLLKSGDLEEAKQHLEEAARLGPDGAAAQNNLGLLHMKLGDYDAAEARLLNALVLAPEYVEAHVNLGNLRARQGDYSGAKQAYEKAIWINDDYPEAHFNYALLNIAAGNLNGAREEFEAAIALEPHCADYLCEYGALLIELGEPEKALDALNRAIFSDPSRADAVFHAAVALGKLGDESGRNYYLNKYLNMASPGDGHYREALEILLFARLGNEAEAAGSFEQTRQ